jgi:purine-nucleoside phosphorylase
MGIYAHELISSYKVKNLVRIGTCGALSKEIKLRDIVMAMASSTDSTIISRSFGTSHFSPICDFDLLKKAYDTAHKLGIAPKVGNVYTTDIFYDEENTWKQYAAHGTLVVEMELAALYTIAAKLGAKALGLLTVSDHLVTHEACTAEERQLTFDSMIKVALEMFH